MANRMFPSYTTADLKKFVAEGVSATRTADTVEKLKAEIEARENGASAHKVTPQVGWGSVKVKVGPDSLR